MPGSFLFKLFEGKNMTKKNTEKKDVVATEEDAKITTEAETIDTGENKSTNNKGLYLRVGAIAMFVGVATLILASVWYNDADDIIATLNSHKETTALADLTNQEVDDTSSVNLLTDQKVTTGTENMSVNNHFIRQNQQSFEDIRKQQHQTVANNLQKQREMIKASFEESDRQRQAMMESALKTQGFQASSFQQPSIKQDPMVKIMETHRVEMMKIMEGRRQQFIKEMNQAYTTRS